SRRRHTRFSRDWSSDVCSSDLIVRAELEFHRRAVGADQCRVQGLIAVQLGNGDVVLELAGYRPVQLVQRAQSQVALGQRVYDDAKTIDVENVGKGLLLLAHLLVDAVERLLAAGDLRFDACRRQRGGYGVVDLAQDFAAIAARGQHGLMQDMVSIGVNRLEAEILQFAEEGVQPQAVRDGRVDFQGLAG